MLILIDYMNCSPNYNVSRTKRKHAFWTGLKQNLIAMLSDVSFALKITLSRTQVNISKQQLLRVK